MYRQSKQISRNRTSTCSFLVSKLRIGRHTLLFTYVIMCSVFKCLIRVLKKPICFVILQIFVLNNNFFTLVTNSHSEPPFNCFFLNLVHEAIYYNSSLSLHLSSFSANSCIFVFDDFKITVSPL